MTFQPNRAAQWKKIQAAGLCPGITSFETYTDAYTKQLDQALSESVRFPCFVPGPEEILIFHRIIFKDIHPWAGTFRGPGESVYFDGGQVGADANRIFPAIVQLQNETVTKLEITSIPQEKVLAIAGFLGALRLIHPFRDGNTRTAVIALEGQITVLFGERERPPLAELDFKQLLRVAYQGNLGPLANRILEREELPRFPSPNLRQPKFDRTSILTWKRYGKSSANKLSGNSAASRSQSPRRSVS